MNPVMSAALLVLSLIPAPRHYYFRYAFLSHVTGIAREDVVASLERGLFRDSLIVPGEPRQLGTGAPRDWKNVDTSAAEREKRSTTLLAIVDVAGDTSSISVVVVVKNILAQSVAGPDTIRGTRASLDTALVESGRRLAKQLALLQRR
jgi:hypothetical protein